MKNILEERLNRIKLFINNGYTADLKTGIVFSPSRSYSSDELKQRGSIDKVNGYIQLVTKVKGKGVFLQAHHLVFYLATGKVVEEIDHINRIRTDNRIENLRASNKSLNMQNKNTKGYSYRSDVKKFRVQISINKKKIELGYFEKEEDARQAYLTAKAKYHTI